MTVLIRKIGPRVFLGSLVLTWAIILIGTGFVKNWKQMVGLRVLLGVMESGCFPGCVYLLSCWYPRCEWIIGYISGVCLFIDFYR